MQEMLVIHLAYAPDVTKHVIMDEIASGAMDYVGCRMKGDR